MKGHWDLGLIPCILWTGCDVFLSTTSIMHLVAIAIYRLLGISYPLHFRCNVDKQQVMVLLVPTWGVSFAIALPLIIQGARQHQYVLIHMEDESLQCGIFDHTFAVYSSLVSFFVPFAVMLFADIRSVQILRKTTKLSLKSKNVIRQRSRSPCSASTKDASGYELTVGSDTRNNCTPESPMIEYKVSSMGTSEQELVSSNISPLTTPHSERAPSQRRHHSKSGMGYIGILTARGMKGSSRERRAEKTLIWVFVCFIVLWLPFFCTNLTYGLCRNCTIPSDLFLAFTWLGYISSGVNPCIYTLLNQDFRGTFKKLVLCRLTPDNTRPSTSIS